MLDIASSGCPAGHSEYSSLAGQMETLDYLGGGPLYQVCLVHWERAHHGLPPEALPLFSFNLSDAASSLDKMSESLSLQNPS